MTHFVSSSCEGERCSMCGNPATHKVGEEIMWDDPQKVRHNFTAYVCCEHFQMIFGPAVPCAKQKPESTLICPRCRVDRFKQPCPDNSANCPMVGEAY